MPIHFITLFYSDTTFLINKYWFIYKKKICKINHLCLKARLLIKIRYYFKLSLSSASFGKRLMPFYLVYFVYLVNFNHVICYKKAWFLYLHLILHPFHITYITAYQVNIPLWSVYFTFNLFLYLCTKIYNVYVYK